MNNFSYIPLEWSGLILMLTGLLLIMIDFGCNHAEGEIIDSNSRTPWPWVDWLEMRFATLLNPIRDFVSVCGTILVISGLGFLLTWFIKTVFAKS